MYWTAYSKNGTVTGPMVYVNYGTVDDYLRLNKVRISLPLFFLGSLFSRLKTVYQENYELLFGNILEYFLIFME